MKFAVIVCIALFSLVWADGGDVINSWIAPGGNPDGLTWIDGHIWITSDDTYMIYECDPADGTVLSSFAGHGSAELTGLSYDGTYLLSCSELTIYFRELPSGAVHDSIPAPNPTANEGLAWDGASIWSTNWNDDLVYELDPSNGNILSYFLPSGADGSTGIVWDGTYLWTSNQGGGNLIYQLIPGTPVPVNFWVAPCEVPQDLAWDGTYIWLTDYVSPTALVYQCDPGTSALAPATWAMIKAAFE